MSDQILQVPPNSTGLKMDMTELSVGSNTVERERINVAGSTDVSLAEVLNSAPTTEYGLVVRNIPSGTQPVSGTVTATGPLTDAQLRASRVPVDGSGVTQPISGAVSFTAPQHAIVDSGTVTAVTTITNVVHVDDNSGSLTVDNGGTFAVQATVAAAATNIAKAEDAASANADVGVPAMAIQLATPADTAGTDGDYAMLQMSAGRLWSSTKIDTALPAGANVIGHVIADSGSTTVVTGNVASTVADGADVTLGAKADAKSSATDTTPISAISVLKQISASVQAPPSQAVTNAGTFATQSAITAASGSIASGAITSGAVASGAIASGAVASGAFASGSIAAGAVAAGATSFVKLEDVASADADAGVPAMAIQKTSPADTAGTDGDYAMLQMSAGRLWAAANIDKINNVAPLMGAGNTGTGSLRVTVASDQAVIPVSDNAGALTVDNAGTFAVQEATLDAALISQEATTSGVKGITAFGAVTTNAPTYTTVKSDALSLDTSGLLRVSLKDTPANTNKFLVTPDSVALPANQSVNVAQIAGGNTVTAGVAGMLAVGGNTATNVAITSDPVLLGGQAVSSENSAVTTARGVQLVADLVGKLIVLPYANPENFVVGVTGAITDTTSTSTIAAQSTGIRTYITSILVTNSHATQGTFVKILDGATIIWEGYAAAAGGGFSCQFPTPLRGTAATAVNTQPVTTGANIIASISGYKGV